MHRIEIFGAPVRSRVRLVDFDIRKWWEGKYNVKFQTGIRRKFPTGQWKKDVWIGTRWTGSNVDSKGWSKRKNKNRCELDDGVKTKENRVRHPRRERNRWKWIRNITHRMHYPCTWISESCTQKRAIWSFCWSRWDLTCHLARKKLVTTIKSKRIWHTVSVAILRPNLKLRMSHWMEGQVMDRARRRRRQSGRSLVGTASLLRIEWQSYWGKKECTHSVFNPRLHCSQNT